MKNLLWFLCVPLDRNSKHYKSTQCIYLYSAGKQNVIELIVSRRCCWFDVMHIQYVFSKYFVKPRVPLEPCAAIPVLPGPGANCHVSSQQQQSVPGILQKSSQGVSAQRPVCFTVHRWSHAVPLHQGKQNLVLPGYTSIRDNLCTKYTTAVGAADGLTSAV